jgi:hypothetical protein
MSAVQDALRELREEAYARVLKCFVGTPFTMVSRRERVCFAQGGALVAPSPPAIRTHLHPTKTKTTHTQTREFIMTKLRTELGISDDRHVELRNALLNGKDAPWFR